MFVQHHKDGNKLEAGACIGSSLKEHLGRSLTTQTHDT